MTEERLCQLALQYTQGAGNVNIKSLISYAGSASKVFTLPKNKLLKIPGVGKKLANTILNKAGLTKAEKSIREIESNDISILFYTDELYPKRLKQIYDSPCLLYYQGTADLCASKILSIVGTRKASKYGRKVTHDIIEGLSNIQPTIISGLAYGIDIEAHKAAINNNLPTIAIIASGIDITYPSIHKKYLPKILSNGGVLSEYPLGTKPEPSRFPARNRIVAGISKGTLVTEAALNGGALITARLAHDYDREVFAVPGEIGATYSEGCNNLIKQNIAQLVSNSQDIAFALNWDEDDNSLATITPSLSESDFTKDEWTILSLLIQQAELHIDKISWQSQVQIGHVASILLNLEFKGIVHSLPGKKYSLR